MSANMVVQTPIRLVYDYTPGRTVSRFLRALEDGRLLGQRCGSCGYTICPPRGACPTCGVAAEELVEVGPRGTVTSFTVVHIPFPSQAVETPYVCAHVVPDGCAVPLVFLLQEVRPEDVRIGMRVEAVWVEPEERDPSLASIKWFRPSGEPDVELDEMGRKR